MPRFGANAFGNGMDPFILPPYLWGKYQIRLVSVTFGENQSKKRKTEYKRVKKVPGNHSTTFPMKNGNSQKINLWRAMIACILK